MPSRPRPGSAGRGKDISWIFNLFGGGDTTATMEDTITPENIDSPIASTNNPRLIDEISNAPRKNPLEQTTYTPNIKYGVKGMDFGGQNKNIANRLNAAQYRTSSAMAGRDAAANADFAQKKVLQDSAHVNAIELAEKGVFNDIGRKFNISPEAARQLAGELGLKPNIDNLVMTEKTKNDQAFAEAASGATKASNANELQQIEHPLNVADANAKVAFGVPIAEDQARVNALAKFHTANAVPDQLEQALARGSILPSAAAGSTFMDVKDRTIIGQTTPIEKPSGDWRSAVMKALGESKTNTPTPMFRPNPALNPAAPAAPAATPAAPPGQEPVLDAQGRPVLDSQGRPVYRMKKLGL